MLATGLPQDLILFHILIRQLSSEQQNYDSELPQLGKPNTRRLNILTDLES